MGTTDHVKKKASFMWKQGVMKVCGLEYLRTNLSSAP